MSERVVVTLRRNLHTALRRHDLGAAEGYLDRLREADPLSVHTRCFELELLVRAGRTEEAARLAERLAEGLSGSARVLFWCGRAAYRARAWGRAATWLAEAARLAPHWASERWLGKALTQLGRLDEAEPILARLHPDHPVVARDLAWLYERLGDGGRALRFAEEHLERFPEDEQVSVQAVRLRAAELEAGELVEEVEALADLGEGVPEAVLVQYVGELLDSGRDEEARRVARERADRVGSDTRLSLGWLLHKRDVFDLSFPLLLRALPERLEDVKLMSALEKSARRTDRIEELRAAYEELAPRQPKLYGRARSL